MSKQRILLTLILSLGSSAALQASPLDSPGVVYIDGLPCNSACQSYMAWSDQALSARHRGERETKVVVPAEAEIERVEPAVRPRVSRQPAPVSRTSSRAGTAAPHKAANTKKAVVPKLAATGKDIPTATVTAAREKAVAGGEVPERKLESSDRPEPAQAASIAAAPPAEAPKSEVKSDVALPPPATLEIAAPPATSEIAAAPATAAGAPASAPRTIQQQVVEATGMADFVTAIGAGREPANKSDNPAVGPGEASDTDKTASASPDEDNLVALVLARPEISSLSDLNNKNIAIEEKQSASSGRVSSAFMAAGAAEVQFSEAKAGAIDRLISGEVPAAVLTLASREAAERFPDIEGFRTFRVPLKARL
ncbi:hypothetical protein [Bradyrhizobium valentinum]|uniref:Uncharacterized protein n=1 Tax=Bradyrhizobium valentinum TaxID=1518501 RepID=A0A0R3M5L6_9BRAD|nr:hypothetical protein [Bradyrhizobium valentinum]KRQ89412.1 hypothetical protein CQ10_37705 [Bradyrhizobium valentinum]KRR12893.1 hypothetical protein CP49_16870 [Bradyrhizobium valentinum]